MDAKVHAWCPLDKEQRQALRAQIDAGAWQHSWYLPSDSYGYIDWNNLETITRIRDVLVDQIGEARRQLREEELAESDRMDALHFRALADFVLSHPDG